MATAVFCIATSEAQAGRIVSELRAAGFSSDDISVLFPDKHGTRDFAHEHNTKAPEGAATGAGARRPARRHAGLARRHRARSRSRASARSSPRARSWPRSAAPRSAPPSAVSPAR